VGAHALPLAADLEAARSQMALTLGFHIILAHFWTGVPIVIAGLGGAFSVVAVNSWLNQPDGFKIASDGAVKKETEA